MDHEHATISATNLELTISVQVPFLEKINHGCVLLPASSLADALNSCRGDEVAIEEKSDGVSVIAGRASFVFAKRESVSELPLYQEIPGSDVPFVRLPAERLSRLFRQGAFCAAVRDTDRPVMKGVMIRFLPNDLEIWSSDMVRLAQARTPSESSLAVGEARAVLPANMIHAFQDCIRHFGGDKTDYCQVSFAPNILYVSGKAFSLWSRLIDGSYPDTPTLARVHMPEHYAEIRAQDFLDIVRQASVLADDTTRTIVLIFSKTCLQTKPFASQAGSGCSDLDIDFSSLPDDITVRMSSGNLQAFLQNFLKEDCETIRIGIRSAGQPLYALAPDGSCMYMVAPYGDPPS